MPQVVPINKARKGKVFEVEKRIRHAININETDMIFFKFKFSFKINQPRVMLIIGVRKYPKEAS